MSWEEMLRQEEAVKLLMEALEATPVEDGYPLAAGDVILSCGHLLHFDSGKPHKREILWCRRCKDERPIKRMGSGKAFRIKCRTCSYTRGKGGRLEAETAAAGHRGKRAHHVVDLLDSTGTVVLTFQDDLEETPTLPDEPPF